MSEFEVEEHDVYALYYDGDDEKVDEPWNMPYSYDCGRAPNSGLSFGQKLVVLDPAAKNGCYYMADRESAKFLLEDLWTMYEQKKHARLAEEQQRRIRKSKNILLFLAIACSLAVVFGMR